MKIRQLNSNFSLLGLYLKARQLVKPVEFEGEYVYETKNMVYLRTVEGKLVKVPKASFSFILDDGTSILGRALSGRPEDRLVS